MSENESCLGRIASLVALAWIVLCSFGTQGGTWLASAVAQPGPLLGINVWVWASLLQSALIVAPLVILFFLFRHRERYGPIFSVWLWAAGYLPLLAVARMFPPTASQEVILAQIGLTLLYWLWLRRSQHPPQHPVGQTSPSALARPENSMLLAISIAAVFSYPWLLEGALGSLLDVLLNGVLGLLFGLTVGAVLRKHPRPESGIFMGSIFTGGIVIGGVVLMMASALSFNGAQLLLMVALPALGWAAVASRAPGTLIGGGAMAILLLVDTDVANLIVLDPLLADLFTAAGIALLLAWFLGGALASSTGKAFMGQRPRLVAATAFVMIGGLLIYFTTGQTGFYGDRLFVILHEQADVSGAGAIADYDARRQSVYETLVTHADTTQGDLRAALTRLGIAHTPYYLVNGIEVQGGLLIRLWLSQRPEVDRVIPSPVLRPLNGPLPVATGVASPPDTPQWNLTSIGAVRVWEELGVTGEGIVIGQSDSGVQVDHPEFGARYRGHLTSGKMSNDYHWYDPWYDTTAPTDYGGHGTHTLGSVLGERVGVAPGATWVGCANLARNLGNPALYLDCMQFMLAPFPQGGNPLHDGDPTRSAHVLNNSWGCPGDAEGCDPTSLQPAVRALRAAGIFVVASAGNDGPRCESVNAPIAIYDDVFVVGATTVEKDLAYFSSAGPVTVDGSGRIKPDIVAPGVEILSAYPNSGYEIAEGTSMAGPHVAGVVALLWSANPQLIGDIDRTEEILIAAATPFTGTVAPLFSPVEFTGERESQTGSPPDEGTMSATEWAAESSPALPTAEDEGNFVADLFTAQANEACLTQINGQSGSNSLPNSLPNNAVGYGIVDAYAAVQLALAAVLK